jgi:hypothetical protein
VRVHPSQRTDMQGCRIVFTGCINTLDPLSFFLRDSSRPAVLGRYYPEHSGFRKRCTAMNDEESHRRCSPMSAAEGEV